MATDFTNNNTTIGTTGGVRPKTANTPLDMRTRVNLKADIELISNPFVGMHIIVLQDETNDNQMTEYVVMSLKANNLGVADMKVNEVVLAKDFLGVSGNGMSSEQVQQLNTAYTHSQSAHVQQSDIPTRIGQLENDSNFISSIPEEYVTEQELNAKGLATETFVTNKIAEAQLSGGEGSTVDLSGLGADLSLNGQTLKLKNSNGVEIGTGVTLPQASGGNISSTNYEVIDDSVNIASWNALGDSITYGMGTSKTYHQYIKDVMHIVTINNYGINSSEITSGSNNPMSERYTGMENNVDIITVFGGVNDFLHNKTLGEFSNRLNDTFYGALHVLCSGLKAKYPNGKIGFITPLKVKYGVFGTKADGTNNLGLKLDVYVTAIKEVCEYYNIPILDLNSLEGFDPNDSTVNSTYFADGLHPNAKGHEFIYPHIMQFIKDLYNTRVILKDTNNQYIYPKTYCNNIYADDGRDLQTIINSLIAKIAALESGSSTIAVTGITLDQDNITLGLSQEIQLNATISPSDATNKNIIWSTSNENCTVVNGLVRGVTEGDCIITATTQDGEYRATCNVTVQAITSANSDNTVITVNIPNNDYTLTLLSADNQIVNEGSIDWGDGSTNVVTNAATSTHTFATAGNYTIQGQFRFGGTAPSTTMVNCLTEVKQMSDQTNTLASAFFGCSNLTKIEPNLTSKISIASLNGAFRNCSKLIEVNMSKFTMTSTDLSFICGGCSQLTSFDLSNCGNFTATKLYSSFNGCSNLTSLNLSTANIKNVTEFTSWLNGCSKLANFVSPLNISSSITINNANLTVTSLLSILNNLATVSGKTLTIGATNIAKLSEEQQAIATDKGWTLA